MRDTEEAGDLTAPDLRRDIVYGNCLVVELS